MNPRVFVYLLLSSVVCAGSLVAAQPPGLWIDVPYIAQAKDGCGSAEISMVMKSCDHRNAQTSLNAADPEHIQAALYSAAAGCIPASKMREYFQESGYRVFA